MFTDKLKGNTVHKLQYLLNSMFPLKKRCIISRTESPIVLIPFQLKNLAVIFLVEKTGKVWGGFARS